MSCTWGQWQRMIENTSITPVILCGGSGTRLWPLSRKSFPKQFVPIINQKSLFELTLNRVKKLSDQCVIVAAKNHRFIISDIIEKQGASGTLLLEPEAKNTAAAMALAAFHQSTKNPQELLLFCPADHHIPNEGLFCETIQKGVPAALKGEIVTFGVVPAFPSTAYGYIKQERTGHQTRATGESFKVEKFIEKPNQEKAEQLLLAGPVLWNAGIFLCTAKTLLNALKRHAPEIFGPCEKSMAACRHENQSNTLEFIYPDEAAFSKSVANSIDYAVLEQHKQVAVVPFEGQWSDVGSWNGVANLTEADDNLNRVEGKGIIYESKKTYVHAPHRPVVALGTEDLLIIDTADAVLVVNIDKAEKVKEVVALLEEAQYAQAVSHRKVHRPWGWYDSVEYGERFQVKRIGVKPGAALSLQKHRQRAEHWIVVKGTAEVRKGKETFLLSENQSTYIPTGEVHRLANPGKIEMELIEVQAGHYLGEDDIIRLKDTI